MQFRLFFAFVFVEIFEISLGDYMLELQAYSELNGRCNVAKDCRPFGYVCRENKTCDCDVMYTPDAHKTKCLGGIDQNCVYDEHCIEGAFCMNQAICKCKETTPIVLDYGMACGGTDRVDFSKFTPFVLVVIAKMF